MLAGVNGFGEQRRTHLRGAGVKEERVVLVCEGSVEVRLPTADAVRVRQSLDLARVATDENRVWHDDVTIGERHAAVIADRNDRADQVLVHAHAPGDAVHDQAESFYGHALS